MWIKKLYWTISVFLLTTSAPLLMACDINSLSIKPMTSQATYDVFNHGNYATTNTYFISADIGDESCTLDIIVQLEDATTSLGGNNHERLNFEWNSQVGSQIANQWHLTLTEKQPTAVIEMRFPSKQWLSAGSYFGLIEMYSSAPLENNTYEVTPNYLPVLVNIPPAVKIHLYGSTDNHYDLDLGELSSNKVINASPNLWVQSNVAYSLILASTYKGKLRHESNDPKWDIPYQININNNKVELNDLEAYIDHNAATFGQPIPMSFVIGNTIKKPGGHYEDTLEISIEPQLSQQPYF